MKKKILVMDDQADFLELVKHRLENHGYEVMTAHDGVEGLQLAKKEGPDLILLDVKMANMDGYTTLLRLRQDEKTKAVPVVVLTAYEGMRDLFRLEGVDDFIVKPFDDKDFISRIARVLK